jgi:hypothetical protein
MYLLVLIQFFEQAIFKSGHFLHFKHSNIHFKKYQENVN